MKWQYKIEMLHLTFAEQFLNDLGEDGWEAVGWWHSELSGLDAEGRHDTMVLLKKAKAE